MRRGIILRKFRMDDLLLVYTRLDFVVPITGFVRRAKLETTLCKFYIK